MSRIGNPIIPLRNDECRPALQHRAIRIGKGTLTTSHGLKLAISSPIVLGGPLSKGGEGVVRRRVLRLGQNDPPALDLVGKLVTRPHPERFAHNLGNGGLGFAGNLVGDYSRTSLASSC